MCKFRSAGTGIAAAVLAAVAASVLAVFQSVAAETYGIGRAPTAAEIAAWDIDVRYDGAGLPSGGGDVATGEVLYETQCAACHGDFGQGEGRWPPLSGGEHSLTLQGAAGRPEKTVGSYWPFAPTLFDYIRRAMPYTRPQSLSDDDAYALSAYVLYLNDIVDDDFSANAESLAAVEMPNRDNFFDDPRPDANNHPCMTDCLNAAELELLESIKGVTPEQESRRGSDNPSPEPGIGSGSVPDSGTDSADSGTDSVPDDGIGAELYARACAVCHDSGIADAPIAGTDGADEWKRRLSESGMDGLLESSLNGKGAMPPQSAVGSRDDIAAAIRHMLKAAGVDSPPKNE